MIALDRDSVDEERYTISDDASFEDLHDSDLAGKRGVVMPNNRPYERIYRPRTDPDVGTFIKRTLRPEAVRWD